MFRREFFKGFQMVFYLLTGWFFCVLCAWKLHYQFERIFSIIRTVYNFRNVSNIVEYMPRMFDSREYILRKNFEN